MSQNKEKDPMIVQIGMRIQKYRIQRNLTQDQVAERAGISQKHLSRIEQGYHNPRFDMIIQIADALNVPTDAFARDLSDHDISVFLEGLKSYLEQLSPGKRAYVKKSIELFCAYESEDFPDKM